MLESFEAYAKKREIIKIISEKTGIPASAILGAFLLFIIFLLLNGIGGLLVTLFLCFMFPAYLTFKALKEEIKAVRENAITNFAKYWIVLSFAVFVYQVIEWFLGDFMFLGIIKFVIAYLMIRRNAMHSVSIFDTLLAPVIAKYESYIDAKLSYLQNAAENEQRNLASVGNELKKAATEKVLDAIIKDKKA